MHWFRSRPARHEVTCRERLPVLAAFLLLAANVLAHTDHAKTVTDAHDFDRSTAFAHSRAAIGNDLGALVFLDHRGNEVHLDALRGRPLVVSLIFTSCYGTCGVLTKHLANTVEVARDALGKNSFSVVTLGFDARADSPSRMAEFARQQKIGDENWLVLSGNESSIAEISNHLGFSFVPSPRGFDHVVQTSIVSGEGKVYRQVYGDSFPTTAMVEPLKELILGKMARASTVVEWITGLKLLCTVYDPSANRYRFDYSIIVAAFSGIICLGAIALFVLKSWNAGHHPGEG